MLPKMTIVAKNVAHSARRLNPFYGPNLDASEWASLPVINASEFDAHLWLIYPDAHNQSEVYLLACDGHYGVQEVMDEWADLDDELFPNGKHPTRVDQSRIDDLATDVGVSLTSKDPADWERIDQELESSSYSRHGNASEWHDMPYWYCVPLGVQRLYAQCVVPDVTQADQTLTIELTPSQGIPSDQWGEWTSRLGQLDCGRRVHRQASFWFAWHRASWHDNRQETRKAIVAQLIDAALEEGNVELASYVSACQAREDAYYADRDARYGVK